MGNLGVSLSVLLSSLGDEVVEDGLEFGGSFLEGGEFTIETR